MTVVAVGLEAVRQHRFGDVGAFDNLYALLNHAGGVGYWPPRVDYIQGDAAPQGVRLQLEEPGRQCLRP